MADILTAISVLMIFFTFLFNAAERQVSEKIESRKPEKDQYVKRKKFTKELYELLFLKIVPIGLVYFITSYTLLPRTVKIIKESKIDLWNFDELNTIFVFVTLCFWGLTIYTIIQTARLVTKIKE